MRTLALPCLAAVVALGAAPRPAVADARHVLERAFPGGAVAGASIALDPGFAGCGPGVASRCRTAGELRVELPAGRAVPAWTSGRLRLAVPAGLAIGGGSVRLDLRTAHDDVVVRVAGVIGTRLVLLARLRAVARTTRDVALPAGLDGVQVSLALEGGIGRDAIAADGANAVRLVSARLVLADARAPRLTVAGALVAGGWLRGPACADVALDDAAGAPAGLGARRLEARLGTALVGAAAAAPTADPFRPRPARLATRLCVDAPAVAGDGTHVLVVRGWDGVAADGNAAEPVALPLRVDATPPAVALGAPAEAGTQTPELAVRAGDATSGLAAVRLTVDGADVALEPRADGALGARLAAPLAWGEHALRAEARDVAGNVRAIGATLLVVDRVPPTIAGLAPADGASVPAGADVRLAARVADAGSGIDRDDVRLALDGVERSLDLDVADDGALALAAGALAPGAHRARLVVRDRAGNRAVATWGFSVGSAAMPDRARPTLTRPSPAPGARVASPVRVAIRLADDGSGIDPATLRVGLDGVERSDATVGADGVVALPAGALAAGRHAVRVVVADRAGNRAEAAWAFTVTAPAARRVLLVAAARTVARRGGVARLRLRGRLVPASAGSVAIEVRRAGRYRLVGRVGADVQGRFAAVVRTAAAGTYVLRARALGAVSRAVSVRVR